MPDPWGEYLGGVAEPQGGSEWDQYLTPPPEGGEEIDRRRKKLNDIADEEMGNYARDSIHRGFAPGSKPSDVFRERLQREMPELPKEHAIAAVMAFDQAAPQAARTHQFQNVLEQERQDRYLNPAGGSMGREMVGEAARLAPFAAPAYNVGKGLMLRGAQERMRQGQETEEDRRDIAREMIRQQEESRQGLGTTAWKAASGLPAAVVELETAGGLSKGLMGRVALQGAAMAPGKFGQQVAPGVALDDRGNPVVGPEKSLAGEAGKAGASGLLEAAVMHGVGQAGKGLRGTSGAAPGLLERAGVYGVPEVLAQGRVSEAAEHGLGLSESSGVIGELTSGEWDRQKKALAQLAGEGGAALVAGRVGHVVEARAALERAAELRSKGLTEAAAGARVQQEFKPLFTSEPQPQPRPYQPPKAEPFVDPRAVPEYNKGRAGPPPAEVPQAPPRPAEVKEPPPPAKGTVRFYHGAAAGGEPGDWLTPNREYAEGYAEKGGAGGKTYYVDVPEGHPALEKAFEDIEGGTKAPYINFQAPPDIASRLKPLPRLWAAPEAQPAPPPPEAAPTPPAQSQGPSQALPVPKAWWAGELAWLTSDAGKLRFLKAQGMSEEQARQYLAGAPAQAPASEPAPEPPPPRNKGKSLIDRMKARQQPAPEQAPGPAAASFGGDTPEQLLYAQAGLTAREAHVLTERRREERSHEEIGADPLMLKPDGSPLTRARVEQIEKAALKKLGEYQSVAKRQGQNPAEWNRGAEAEAGALKPPTDWEKADPEDRAQAMLERILQGHRTGDMTPEQLDGAWKEYHDLMTRLAHPGHRGPVADADIDNQVAQLRKEIENEPVPKSGPGLAGRGVEAPVRRGDGEQTVPQPQEAPGPATAAEDAQGRAGALPPAAAPAVRGEAPGGELGFGAPLSEAERAGAVGGGQEGPGEERPGEERPKQTFALANAKVDERRAAEGLPPLMSEARRTNQEVWDRAMGRLERDPEAGAKLVDELATKKRATTDDENALLLQRQVALRNEHSRVAMEYVRGMTGGADATTLDDLERREADLSGQVEKTDRVIRDTGSEWGRAGQFRKQLAAEDFSLSGMLQKAAAAKGEPLTPQEKAQIAALQQRIKELQKQLEQSGEPPVDRQGRPSKPSTDAGRAEGEFRQRLGDYRARRRSTFQKVTDLLVKLRVNEIISAPTTLAKIVGASAWRFVTTPLEGAAGALWSRIPGLSKIAAMAPREGPNPQGITRSLAIEKQAALSGLTDGFLDVWKTARTGQSDLDVAHKPAGVPRGWLDLQFSLHDAMKAPAVRAEYTRSFLQRVDHAAAAGEDVTHPETLLRISAEAYQDGQAAKFRGENWFADMVNRALTPGPNAGVGERVAKTAAKVVVAPVVRIPANIVAETGNYLFGTGVGAARALNAWRNGLESLKPHEADAIMRNFKKGSLGLGLLALGFLRPEMFGGYYRDDEKKKPGEPGFGEAKVGDATIPRWAMHHPLLQVPQFGATVRRVFDEVSRKDGAAEGAVRGPLAGVLGLAEEVPMARGTKDLGKAFSSREQGAFFGELAKSLAVPQLVQWLAGRMDVDPSTGNWLTGEPVRRQSKGLLQHVESGLPWLRQGLRKK